MFCPKCNHDNLIEIVFVEPANERGSKTDRRKNSDQTVRYTGPNKRRQERRRLAKHEASGPKPNTMCLACEHEWYAASSSPTELRTL